jgi:hypothetical protein
LATEYTIDVLIALEGRQRPTKDWWLKRYEWGAKRAGGMPPEVADPLLATRKYQTDPDTGEHFACITLPFPEGTSLARMNELAHMLSSCLTAEGYTLRHNGERFEIIPGMGEPDGTLGAPGYSEARVYSPRCLSCVFACDNRFGCCTEGAAFSLADIGSVLLKGGEERVAQWLALPGEMDGVKWHPYLANGRCALHDPSVGCTLPTDLMPLQCRTYLCMPDKLLRPEALVDYEGYVDALEEAEAFIEDHMRQVSGVEIGSPLSAIKDAAAKAFAAWEAGER